MASGFNSLILHSLAISTCGNVNVLVPRVLSSVSKPVLISPPRKLPFRSHAVAVVAVPKSKITIELSPVNCVSPAVSFSLFSAPIKLQTLSTPRVG